MNDQFDNPDMVERTDKDTNNPVANSDPFTDKVPGDAALVPETPMGETFVHETPMGETVVHETPMVETIVHEAPISTNAGSLASLLKPEEAERFRTRWNEIQSKFVDEPRSAVQQADALVSEVIEQITQMFASEHSSLEGQWNQGSDVSTEDLRKALQRYRSFFNRLVV